MPDFYLPFNYLIAEPKVNGKDVTQYRYDYFDTPTTRDEPSKEKQRASEIARHDLSLQGTISGRILCRLRICSPTIVVGNLETLSNQHKIVYPFKLNGELAIPGSSLRGMVSSITEAISQSSMRAHDTKRQTSFDKRLLPWGNTSETLTPADLLFGFAQENRGATTSQNDVNSAEERSRNFASRLNFSDAAISKKHPPEFIGFDVTLPALPKPQTSYITNGRKFYLPFTENEVKQVINEHQPHQNRRNVTCKEMTKIATFYFHVDFKSLYPTELTLLLRSLSPSKDYKHQLGLGKSLGLGRVSIDILHLFEEKFEDRYGIDALSTGCYTHAKSNGSIDNDKRWEEIQRYQNEKLFLSQLDNSHPNRKANETQPLQQNAAGDGSFDALFNHDSLIDNDTLTKLVHFNHESARIKDKPVSWPTRNTNWDKWLKPLQPIPPPGYYLPLAGEMPIPQEEHCSENDPLKTCFDHLLTSIEKATGGRESALLSKNLAEKICEDSVNAAKLIKMLEAELKKTNKGFHSLGNKAIALYRKHGLLPPP